MHALRPLVRARINEYAKANGIGGEKKVAVLLALRIDRWAVSIDALLKAGMFEEAWGLLRIQVELFVHLHYILFGGTEQGHGSPEDLAFRYLDYAPYKNWTVIRKAKRNGTLDKKFFGKSDAERLATIRRICRQASDANKAHQFTSIGRNGKATRADSWARYGFADLLKWVLSSLPHYVSPQIREILSVGEPSRSIQSARLHADPFADRGLLKTKDGVTIIDEVPSGDTMTSQLAAQLAYYSWMAVGKLLGFDHEVEKCFVEGTRKTAEAEMATLGE